MPHAIRGGIPLALAAGGGRRVFSALLWRL
jgi:hypothetical protein